jgi:hypothetical protein
MDGYNLMRIREDQRASEGCRTTASPGRAGRPPPFRDDALLELVLKGNADDLGLVVRDATKLEGPRSIN